jgi:hypothetical protein
MSAGLRTHPHSLGRSSGATKSLLSGLPAEFVECADGNIAVCIGLA